MNRLAQIVLACAIFLSYLGFGSSMNLDHMFGGDFAMHEMRMCTNDVCDPAPLACAKHCIAAFVNDAAMPMIAFGVAFVFIAIVIFFVAPAPFLARAPVVVNRPPPTRLWVRATAKRE
ncbi:MAG: hypothetical protein NUV56_03110 [Candidatus Uhrbacteria bacterium]|nr:hypothetical protein [Candidatus Uhrbacteria bacterium]